MNQEKPVQNYRPVILPEAILELHEALVKARSAPACRQAALAIIDEYFYCFSRTDMRQDMWTLLSGALSCKYIQKMKKSVHRQNLLFFYEFTLVLMDAVHSIYARDNNLQKTNS